MTSARSVVVTGTSTGICVKVLTAAGFHVFGTVRKPADAERLTKEFGQALARPHDWRPHRPLPAQAMRHQPPPRGDGLLPVTITHLELAPADWTRRGLPPAIEIDIVREPAPTAAMYLELYDRVGRPWLWYERRLLGEEALTALLNRPGHEVHVARHDGALVGYFELYDDEVVFFGLTPDYIGRHIGPWLLDRAIERGFARGAATLILNTNTVDHPRALQTYRKAGFRIVRAEEKLLQDPRVRWPDIYRWPPN